MPSPRRLPCKVTSRSDWHYLALSGTPGKVPSANSPWSERTTLRRKSRIFIVLSRLHLHVTSTQRPINQDPYGHSYASDVSYSAPPGNDAVPRERVHWHILETGRFRLETGPAQILFGRPDSGGDLTVREARQARTLSELPTYNIRGFPDFIDAPRRSWGAYAIPTLCAKSAYNLSQNFILSILLSWVFRLTVRPTRLLCRTKFASCRLKRADHAQSP